MVSKQLTTKKFCSRDDFKQVIVNSYDAIGAVDGKGNILLCNPAAGKLFNESPREIMGKNVRQLLEKGLYSPSIVLETIEKRKEITGLIKNRNGSNIMCTGTPIFDEDGEISLVIVNFRDQDIVDKYLEALDKEAQKTVRYKTATEYLNGKEPGSIVAESKKMKEVIANSVYVAKSDSTVILFGETGSGKEVVAKHIHRNSSRAKEPFIPVNCAAIPSELLESEFFGYDAGAFTGASSKGKLGIFEIAHKGTLFLDEIGDMPLAMQSKLLLVIETGQVRRLGSARVFQTDVRLIAATNKDLKAMVDQKTFRSDLYYRLNVIPIHLPPLRERPEDVMALAERFLQEFNRKYALKKKFTSRAIRSLLAYNWPGNVRELRNIVERLVVTSSGDYLEFGNDALFGKKDSSPDKDSSSVKPFPNYNGSLKSVLKRVEEEYIAQVLAECNGRVGKAAQRLGIHRTVLYRKTRARTPL